MYIAHFHIKGVRLALSLRELSAPLPVAVFQNVKQPAPKAPFSGTCFAWKQHSTIYNRETKASYIVQKNPHKPKLNRIHASKEFSNPAISKFQTNWMPNGHEFRPFYCLSYQYSLQPLTRMLDHLATDKKNRGTILG
jgi:hypothetical protein